MKRYRATITGDRYPLDFTVEATSWSTATARAVRLWQKRFKRNRTDTLTIKIVRVADSKPAERQDNGEV